MAATGNSAFRDYVVDGVPSSGPHTVVKSEAREAIAALETLITAVTSAGGKTYATLSAMNADLTPAANTPAIVYADPTPANNRMYAKVGGAGTGSWGPTLDFILGAQIVRATDVGAGTAAAIQATTALAVPTTSGAIVIMNIFEQAVGSPITVSFNGAAALTVTDLAGRNYDPQALRAGATIIGVISGTHFRVVSNTVPVGALPGGNSWMRPGDALGMFTAIKHDSTGELLPLAWPVVQNANGQAVRVTGGNTTVAMRAATALEPGRQYTMRWALRRATDPAVPATSYVVLGIAWMDAAKAALGVAEVAVQTLTSLTVASGRYAANAIVSTSALAGTTVVAPAGAVYARPYIQFFGPDGVTDVEAIASYDITDTSPLTLGEPAVASALASAATATTKATEAAASATASANSATAAATSAAVVARPNLIERWYAEALTAGVAINDKDDAVESGWSFTLTGDGVNARVLRLNLPQTLVNGQPYSISFMAQVTSGAAPRTVRIDYTDPSPLEVTREVTGTAALVSYINASDANINLATNIRIFCGALEIIPNGTVIKIWNVKLEAGATATAWTPPQNNRLVRGALARTRNLIEAGAAGNATTDDTPAIQAALNALGSGGGTVLVPNGRRFLVDTALTIPSNCHLVGPHSFVGTSVDNASVPYNIIGGALILNTTATITMNGGSSLSGLFVLPKGMTFPQNDASAFAGTALTGLGDDIGLEDLAVFGFSKTYFSNGTAASRQRLRASRVYFDSIDGFDVLNSLDIAYVSQCHGWPFATVGRASPPADLAYLRRSGTAYKFRDVNDWTKFSECFSFGWQRGAVIENANNVEIIGCSFDNTFVSGAPNHTGAVGIEVKGSSTNTIIWKAQTAAQQQAGVLVNVDAGKFVAIHGHVAWGKPTHAVQVLSGDVRVSNGRYQDIVNGVTVSSATSNVNIQGTSFSDYTGHPVNPTVSTTRVTVHDDNTFSGTGSIVSTPANLGVTQVASADPLLLPNSVEMVIVTGTTAFGNLQHGWAGRIVTLRFAAACSVFNSTGTQFSMRLAGGTSFTSAAGSTLTLRHDGTQWFEISRSA